MGAFFLYNKYSEPDLASTAKLFKDKGFRQRAIFKLGDYILWLYRKIKINYLNYFENDNYGIYLIGTPIYKGMPYNAGMVAILEDYSKGLFKNSEVKGTYVIIIRDYDFLKFFSDEGCLQSIYYIKNQIISSSFLGVAFSFPDRLRLNKKALAECLITGNLIGPDTFFLEIYRNEKFKPFNFKGIDFIQVNESVYDVDNVGSYKQSVKEQVTKLEDYFKYIKQFADDMGIYSGLTGGFDSRLLFILAKKYFKSVRFFTHSRKDSNKDYNISQELCNLFGLQLSV